MNLILFQTGESDSILPAKDERSIHIRKILKAKPGDSIRAGLIGQGIGSIILDSVDDDIHFHWETPPVGNTHPASKLELLIGLSRPPTCQKILKELTALGVSKFHFTGTELGEKSYASSSLWKDRAWRSSVIEGMVQGVTVCEPELQLSWSLKSALKSCEDTVIPRLFLDPEKGFPELGQALPSTEGGVCIAIGSERGWTTGEKNMLIAAGFIQCRLGSRILRTETACVSASAIALSHMGYLS